MRIRFASQFSSTTRSPRIAPGRTASSASWTWTQRFSKRRWLTWPSRGYQVISFPALVDALEHGTGVPPRSVVITFDDGWETQYAVAFPILRQLHFTATFFIFSQPIGVDPGYMTWAQVKELQTAGMTIAAHSRTHPKLTLPNVSLAGEVAGSRGDIQRELGRAPDIFAYPYGIWDDPVASAVRAAGFQAARALSGGEWNSASNLYALHSVLATDNMQLFEGRSVRRTLRRLAPAQRFKRPL